MGTSSKSLGQEGENRSNPSGAEHDTPAASSARHTTTASKLSGGSRLKMHDRRSGDFARKERHPNSTSGASNASM
jgi:hypothetical protein